MNILHVTSMMDPKAGGVSQAIKMIIFGLAKAGVNNEVVCLDNATAPFLESETLKIHALGPGRTPWFYSFQLLPWLKKNIGRFDVVLIHGLWQYHSYITFKVLRSLSSNKIQLLVMPHGMLDPYFQYAPERKLKAIRNWLYWKCIEERLVNSSGGLLFTCETEMLLARQPFRPYKPLREFNIGFGIQQPPTFSRILVDKFLKRFPDIQGNSYFLFLSRIHKKKGLENLIRAYERLLTDFQHVYTSMPKLVIAGPGLDTIYGKGLLEHIMKSILLRNNIVFTGMLTGDDKWSAIYGCGAFILPSHQENFGIAVVEALACKKPVLISKEVNIWREINNEEAGIIESDTENGTFKMLSTWLELSEIAKVQMGQNAFLTFQKYFSIMPAAKKILAAISHLTIN